MAKHPGGRPKKGEEDKATKYIRMYADLVDMISEIVEVANIRGERLTAARLLDPLVRKHVVARHATDLPAIKQMRAARDAIRGDD